MTLDELIKLTKKNCKLRNYLKEDYLFLKEFEIIEFDGKWDAEDKFNFETPLVGLKIGDKRDFELYNVVDEFSDLYDHYNWAKITLTDNRLVFITETGEIIIVKWENHEDGGVELTEWGLF
jgi:hypothetical protein